MFALAPVGVRAEAEPAEVMTPPQLEPKAVPSDRPTGWAVQGLPIVTFNTDEGLGYGALVMMVDRADGSYQPFRYQLVLQVFLTTGGISAHFLQVDAPRVFGTPWRVGAKLRYGFDKFAPYYGVGNTAEYDPLLSRCSDREALASDPDVCPGNDAFRGLRYYSYQIGTFPEIELDVRREISGPWKAFVGHRFRLSEVRARYSAEELGQTGPSRFLEDAAAGNILGYDSATGDAVQVRLSEVAVALQYDKRDQEASTTDGVFHELAARASARAIGSQFDYWGASLHLRWFHPFAVPGGPLVVALRGLGDVLVGEVPFFRLATFGGLGGKDGIGGVYSARGIVKNRVQGAVKLLGNAELRWTPVAFAVAGQRFEVGGVAFLDAGRVWSDIRLQDGGGVTSGAGGGLRIIWNREFVVRVDYGVGLTDPTSGLYIEFGQIF